MPKSLKEYLVSQVGGWTALLNPIWDFLFNMKLYIAGKISGLPKKEYKANFNKAEKSLRKLGHEVVNPTKLPHNHDQSWESFMKEDLTEMLKCDAVILLHNWRDSMGAQIERKVASLLNMKIYDLTIFLHEPTYHGL